MYNSALSEAKGKDFSHESTSNPRTKYFPWMASPARRAGVLYFYSYHLCPALLSVDIGAKSLQIHQRFCFHHALAPVFLHCRSIYDPLFGQHSHRRQGSASPPALPGRYLYDVSSLSDRQPFFSKHGSHSLALFCHCLRLGDCHGVHILLHYPPQQSQKGCPRLCIAIQS